MIVLTLDMLRLSQFLSPQYCLWLPGNLLYLESIFEYFHFYRWRWNIQFNSNEQDLREIHLINAVLVINSSSSVGTAFCWFYLSAFLTIPVPMRYPLNGRSMVPYFPFRKIRFGTLIRGGLIQFVWPLPMLLPKRTLVVRFFNCLLLRRLS